MGFLVLPTNHHEVFTLTKSFRVERRVSGYIRLVSCCIPIMHLALFLGQNMTQKCKPRLAGAIPSLFLYTF